MSLFSLYIIVLYTHIHTHVTEREIGLNETSLSTEILQIILVKIIYFVNNPLECVTYSFPGMRTDQFSYHSLV